MNRYVYMHMLACLYKCSQVFVHELLCMVVMMFSVYNLEKAFYLRACMSREALCVTWRRHSKGTIRGHHFSLSG